MPPDESSEVIRILMELRPALGGHAGIPQATRLLFRNLAGSAQFALTGLIQSHNKVLARGVGKRLPNSASGLSRDKEIDRYGRVVISIEQGVTDWYIRAVILTVLSVIKHAAGGAHRLRVFDAEAFHDFVWRRFFENTLPPEDFEQVVQAAYRVVRLPWTAMHLLGLFAGNLGINLYPRLDTRDFDIMIAETPYPGRVSRNTSFVIRYHDAIPLLMPHTISDRRWHQAFHYRALRQNANDGAWFVCVSEATRTSLLSVFPQIEDRSLTIHNSVSHHYFDEEAQPGQIGRIIKARLNKNIPRVDFGAINRSLANQDRSGRPFEFLLVVSTIEPRKNHLNLLNAWERLRASKYEDLFLIVVGALGWHHRLIVQRFRPWMEQARLFLLTSVLSSELRMLYKMARATICPSFGEGFDFSGVEAMRSGGVVVASDLPVHREIYAEGAEYFNPYSVDSMAEAIDMAIRSENSLLRHELIEKGRRVGAKYGNESILPKWTSFLDSLYQKRRSNLL